MAQYELNLHDYWRIIRRRKLTIILTFVFILTSTVIYTGMQQPIYETFAILQIESSSVLGKDMGMSLLSFDPWTEVQTFTRIINSSTIFKKVAANLGLLDGITDEDERNRIVSQVGAKMYAKRMPDVNLIRVYGVSPDPQEAALISNEASKAFMLYSVESRVEQIHGVKEFYGEQLEQAEKKLRDSEEARKIFIEKTEATGLGRQLTGKLMALEEKREILLKKYTNSHPEVKKLNSQIARVKRQLQKLPASDLELVRLTREIKVNESSYLALKRKYYDVELSEADDMRRVSILASAAVPDRPARPNKKLNVVVGILMGILLGVIFALITENLDTSIGTIEDVEAFLKLPVLGVIPHIELDKKDNDNLFQFKGKDKAHKIDRLYHSLIFFHSLRSPFVEAYHTLRTNIKFTELGNKGAAVLFTSSGVGEGKSVTAVNYAISASMVGIKTLLVELDLRRPIINKIFGLQKEYGLTNVLQGNIPWQEAVKGTSDFMLGRMGIENVLKAPGLENLKILTCGSIPPNPVDMLNSAELVKLFSTLKKEFELIVIDSPPVLLFADAMIASNKVDGVIIVYQVGKMARGALSRTKIQLENVKANIKGVVLNDIRASEMESRYGYYYSSYKYYSKPYQDQKKG